MSYDRNVLLATLKTLKVFENSNYFRSRVNLSSFENEDLESHLGTLTSSLTADSHNVFSNAETLDFEKNIFDDHKLSYSELKTVIERINLVNEMYKHHVQEKKEFQKEGNNLPIQDSFADIMDTSIVSKKIDQIKSVVEHIKIIAAEGVKLKQVLRSSVLNDNWKINKAYHKSVLTFFKLVSELIGYIEFFVRSLESSQRYSSESPIILKNKEMKILAVLNENMDLLTDFKSYVQKYINL